jgi:thiosulfate/3-mercaptopyruvate sulfurtransferase
MMAAAKQDYRHSKYLVETDWLEQHLGDANLRIFDCTVSAKPNPDKSAKLPFIFTSCFASFKEGHIPGAGFLDLLEDLSDATSELPFLMPSEQQFISAMAKAGIDDDTRVVLYGMTDPIWAARVWWMLHAFGFDNAAILNGGWNKWNSEERPISTKVCTYSPGRFTLRARKDCFVNKSEVLAAIGTNHVRTINALPSMVYSGTGGPVFGRKGRITGSVNVPFASLHDPDTGAYLPADQLQEKFVKVDVESAEQIIVYCGSGIAASNDAFALALLGYDNVAVYDASLAEWGFDPSLPMEAG